MALLSTIVSTGLATTSTITITDAALPGIVTGVTRQQSVTVMVAAADPSGTPAQINATGTVTTVVLKVPTIQLQESYTGSPYATTLYPTLFNDARAALGLPHN